MAHASALDLPNNIDPNLRDAHDFDLPSPFFHTKSKSPSDMSLWQEPSPRHPVPSFMDYRGLARQGVLENMMPLGTLPTTKARARARADPLRKTVQARNLESFGFDRLTPAADSTLVESSSHTEDGSSNSGGEAAAAAIVCEPQHIDEDAKTSRGSTASAGQDSSHESESISKTMMEQGHLTPSRHATAHSNGFPVTPSRSSVTKRKIGSSNRSPISPFPSVPDHLPMPSGSIFDRAFKEASKRSKSDLGNAIPWLHLAAQQDLDYAKALYEVSKKSATSEQKRNYSRKLHYIKKRVRSYVQNPASAPDPFKMAHYTSLNGTSASQSPSQSGPETRNQSAFQDNSMLNTEQLFQQRRSPHNRSESQMSPPSKRLRRTSSPSLRTSSQAEILSSWRASSDNKLKLRSNAIKPSDKPIMQPYAHPRGRPKRGSSSSLSEVDQTVLDEGPPEELSTPVESVHPSNGQLREAEERTTRLRGRHTAMDVPESFTRPQAEGTIQPHPPSPTIATPGFRTLELAGITSTKVGLSPEVANLPPPTALGRPPKRAKPEAPRVKLSPQKLSRVGIVAGIPPSAKRIGVSGNDDDREAVDNSDFCTSCGGTGLLLCCDGCDRSFHFTCLDPPLAKGAELAEPWYCYNCKADRGLLDAQRPGLFRLLLQALDSRNPSAFRLPAAVSGYFENVQAGEDGEFVENRRRRITVKNADSAPDYLRTRDAKGNLIICNACSRSTDGQRPIITCDYCALNWHLDCLNPPLANPPSKSHAWMCPAHTDHDLRHLDPIEPSVGVTTDVVGRTHRVRRPKAPRIVDTVLSRGHRNNGLIEIANDPEPDYGLPETDDESDDDESTDGGDEEDGVIYRLPERGVKLDFIHKIKSQRQREEAHYQSLLSRQNLRNAQLTEYNLKLQAKQLRRYSIVEREAAQNLAAFALSNEDLDLRPETVQNLIRALEMQAPPGLLDQLQKGTPPPSMGNLTGVGPHDPEGFLGPGKLSQEEFTNLKHLQELIRRRLEAAQ